MDERPETERRVGDIARWVVVDKVDYAKARAVVLVDSDEGKHLSGPLPWAAWRAGKTRIWSAPSVGEQMMLITPEGELAGGFLIPAAYCGAFAAPSNKEEVDLIVFDDGTEIAHNTKSHELTIKMAAGGKVIIDAPGGVEIKGDVSIDGEVTVTGDVTAGDISLIHHTHPGVQAGGASTGQPQ